MNIKRRFLFFILLLITIIPSIIFSQDDEITTTSKSLEEYIREGKTKINRYFYDDAKVIFEEALKIYPEDWRLNWYYLNLLEKRERHYTERGSAIIPYYEERVKENPESPTAYAGLAYGYLKLGKKMLAREMVEKSREKDEHSLAAFHIKAIILKTEAYQEEQKKAEAFKAYNELLQKHPDFFEGYQDFFDEYKYKADLKTNPLINFQAKWDRALKCPNFDPILYLLETTSFEGSDDKEKYMEVYEKILRQDPTHAEIKYKLAYQYLDKGKTEQGLNLLKKTVAEAPNFEEAVVFLANIYSGLMEYDLSNEILKTLMDKGESQVFHYSLLYIRNLYQSGRFEEAIEFLENCIRDVNYSSIDYEEKLLSELKSSKPDKRVKIIPGIPFLVQKRNYCGPASVSMILRYWGLPFNQDEIAERIYIKGLGTIPKTAQNYIHSLGFRTFVFKGSDEIWKKVLDLDIPILLVLRSYKSAHAVVIAGYDDFAREFILHDPNLPYLENRPYSLKEEKRIFRPGGEGVLQCMLIIPEDKIEQYDLSFIRMPISIRTSNLVSHLLMGSAILSGVFHGLLVNGAYALVILFLVYLTIRKTIFPNSPKNLWRFLSICLILEIVINVFCASFDSVATTAILIIYHASLILFLMICLYSKALHIFLQFYVPLSFFVRSYVVTMGLGVLLIKESKEMINETLSSGMIVIAVLIIFYPLMLLIYFKYLVDNRKYSTFFRFIRKFRWIKGEKAGYLSAAFMESIVYLQQGEHDKSLARLDEILEFPYLSRQYRFRIKTLILENLLEKLKEQSADHEEISKQAEALIKEIKEGNPKGWNKFVLLLLSTDFSIVKADYEEALRFQEEADKIYSSKNIFNLFQKKLEHIRFFVERLRSVKIHYDLNRLALARHFERKDIIAEIAKKYQDKLDLDFKRNRFLQDLTR